MIEFLATYYKQNDMVQESESYGELQIYNTLGDLKGNYEHYFTINELLLMLSNYLNNLESIPEEFKTYYYLNKSGELSIEKDHFVQGFIVKNEESDFFYITIYDDDKFIDTNSASFQNGSTYMFSKYFDDLTSLNEYLRENKNVELISKYNIEDKIYTKLIFKE